MSKALIGYVGPAPAHALMRELDALKARVAELERAVADQPLAHPVTQVAELSAVPDSEAALA